MTADNIRKKTGETGEPDNFISSVDIRGVVPPSRVFAQLKLNANPV